ncbi:hypothetical protein jhhlp_007898 [Lomentospora prolificans]|uniref:Glucose-methanol-choline oxidoreductase N-terminal domain-containing protein n=1 Tax=Lomentospora prolificans TaxID=41688 RepID=A0A2N3N0W0_9PEZI|nr:hypothetical protein jhhlp_007898 [Lomentospora prolificans]
MTIDGEYDFIIVGAGPAGSAVAYGLSVAAGKDAKILLIEAGGPNDDRNLRVDGQRWITFFNEQMNWGYKTAPQVHCANREINYARGKGMGGSSAINFSFFTVGPKGDYDEWARLVGDQAFSWKNMQARLKTLETFHLELPAGVDPKYASPRPGDHGDSGPLDVGYAREWEEDLVPLLGLFEDAGYPLNQDHNSGNPLGMGLVINSAHAGLRSTAADLLKNVSEKNVTILTDTAVQRVVLDGKKVIGVESSGKRYLASKEVILCAGTLDSPRILMHSGIGPGDQLRKFDIPVALDAPYVGSGLKDHTFTLIAYKRTPESGSKRGNFYTDQVAMDAALEQWKKDGAGDWSKFACQAGIGFFKLPDTFTSSAEFLALPDTVKEHLNHETVPHFEVVTHIPQHYFLPDFAKDDKESYDYMCFGAMLLNGQGQGNVTLQSSDPNVPLLFDPKFLEHPFDRRAAIETLREVLKFTKIPAFAKDTLATIAAPKSDSDEDILEYCRQTLTTTWHMTGTAKMGRRGDEDAVVDSEFRVIGIEGLRVADMSVVPVMANCHTQAVAYLTGLTCAERIAKSYGYI